MDDDLDELLDEVESKFCHDVSIRPAAHTDPVKSVKCDKESEGQRTQRHVIQQWLTLASRLTT